MRCDAETQAAPTSDATSEAETQAAPTSDATSEAETILMAETPAEFRERMLSVSVARTGELVRVNAKEREWSRDMAAFRLLVDQGYMPPRIDGCDERAAKARTAFDIEAT